MPLYLAHLVCDQEVNITRAKCGVQQERIVHLEAEFQKVKVWRTQQQQKVQQMKVNAVKTKRHIKVSCWCRVGMLVRYS